MDAKSENNRTTVEKKSEREVIVTRTFNASARIVFDAWTKPEVLAKWWGVKSMGMALVACEIDLRTGGSYRFTIGHQGREMVFFGKYLEVTPHSKLVWSNEESPDGAVTTLTFEEKDGKTRLVMSDLYPSKEAYEKNHGGEEAMAEMYDQLDAALSA